MVDLIFNSGRGYGKIRIGNIEYTVIKTCGVYSFGYSIFSDRFIINGWILENKKRLSTIKKYAIRYGVNIITV